MKRGWRIAALVTLAFVGVIGVGHLALSDRRSATVPAKTPERNSTPKKRLPVVHREVCSAREDGACASEGEVVDAWVEGLPREFQSLGQRVVDAAEGDDLEVLKGLVPEVLRCASADVRLRMVESLDWHGKDAIVELTMFLMDRDGTVADAAFNAWDTAIDQVENESFRVAVAADVMKTSTNADHLEGAVTKIESADDRRAAVLALADVAESGNEAASGAVREAYEFIVGEEWVDAATARTKALTVECDE